MMRDSDDPHAHHQGDQHPPADDHQLQSSPRGFSAYTRTLSTASDASADITPRNPLHDMDAQQLASACGPVLGNDGAAANESGVAVRVPLGNVEGRVFERLARFRLLPPALKLQSDAAVAYLLSPVVFHTVFDAPSLLHRALCWSRNALSGQHFVLSTSSNPRVSGARLLRYLRRYLQVASGIGTQDADAAQQLAQTLLFGGLLSPEREKKRRFAGLELNAQANDLEVEGMAVIDDHKHLYELVAPGARSLGSSESRRQDDNVVSVWDVADGAMRAGFVFRKPPRKSVLHSGCCSDSSASDASTSNERVLPCNGKVSGARELRVYAVVNGPRRHALVLFRDDVARASIAYVPLLTAIAQYTPSASTPSRQCRGPLLYHGLQVWYRPSTASDESRCETLDFLTKQAQERWLRALLDAGAVYREVHADRAAWSAPTASFYALMASRQRLPIHATVNPDGDVLDFATLRDRVVLVVNMPTKEPGKAAAARVDVGKQLRELMELADRYGPDGFTMLVFPCAQFSDCDDSDDDSGAADEMDEQTVAATDDVTDSSARTSNDSGVPPFVQVLAPCDVNGPDAHEVFLFLNARLPGRFGPCVDGDYCKFVVSRDGEPVERFPSAETPETDECELARVIREQLGSRDA